jgi:hypothetical protein
MIDNQFYYPGFADLVNSLLLVYFSTNQEDNAYNLITLSVKIIDKNEKKNSLFKGVFLKNIGFYYFKKENYKKAEDFFLKSKLIIDSVNS